VELEELRGRVEAALKESGKRVVVLMDDIDRLDKAEVQTVFRLVKLVADFKSTAYVLAFDAAMVASALRDRYSAQDAEAGQNFLEKIIQVPLDLPHVSPAALRRFCLEVVGKAVDDAQVELTEEEVRHFLRGFDAGLMPRLHTPRVAKRYGNILSFALPILKGEVNVVDLMLVEGVRALYPKLYDAVGKNPDSFLGRRFTWDRRVDEEANQHVRDVINKALEGISTDEKDAAIQLLKLLFPRLESVYGGTHYSEGFEEQWSRQRRIASQAYFQRYLSYAVPEGQVTDQQLNHFTDMLGANIQADVDAEWEAFVSETNSADVVEKLRSRVKSLDPSAASKLARAICRVGSLFPNPAQFLEFTGPFSQAAMLVSDCIDKVATSDNHGAGYALAADILRDATPLPFCVEIFSWISSASDESDGPATEAGGFSDDERAQLGLVITDKIKAHLCENFDGNVVNLGQNCRLLRFWAAYGSRDDVNQFIADWLDKTPHLAVQLLNNIRPTGWNMQTGIPSKSRFDRDSYNALIGFVDAEILDRALERLFGPWTPREAFPRFLEDVPADALLAEQFCWIHAHVLKNENNAGEPANPSTANPVSEEIPEGEGTDGAAESDGN